MTRYAITYDRPRKYDYRPQGTIGSVETNLVNLGGTVRRRAAGPKTTIGFKAHTGVTNKQVRHAVRLALRANLGKALVAQLDTNVEAWTWPAHDTRADRVTGRWRRLI